MKILNLFVLLILPFFSSAQQPFAIVELFTSEGSATCPPADDLLNKIKTDAEKAGLNIFTLAYHVDYWNRFGWKDPFSKFQFTVRQENYSRVLAEKEMYTPEAVINGTYSCVGSKKKLVNENIQKALSKESKSGIEIKKDSLRRDTLFLSYSFSSNSPDYVLRIVLTEDSLFSKVDKGENAGMTLFHDSVVRSLFSVDKPGIKGQAKIYTNIFSGKGKRHLIAFIQHRQNMQILAVTKSDL